ncbi:MAG: leucine-rich repeat domain-containing protein [Clostridia bacterium]|nr:leucine-rich repeat domain-containing protein [Clostridia bacterium]
MSRSTKVTGNSAGKKALVIALVIAAALAVLIPVSWIIIARSANPAQPDDTVSETADGTTGPEVPPQTSAAPADTLPVLCNHSFGEWKEYKGEPCKTPDCRERFCSLCGYAEREATAPTEHSFVGRVCQYCGYRDLDTATVYRDPETGVDLMWDGRFLAVTGPGSFAGGELTLPSYFDGVPVSGVKKEAFRDCATLTSLKIKYPLYYISNSAFEGCTNLKSVTISITATDDGSFSSPSLQLNLGQRAFAACPKLDTFTADCKLNGIDYGVFYESYLYPHDHQWESAGSNSYGYPFCCGEEIAEERYCRICGKVETVKTLGTFQHQFYKGVCKFCLAYDPQTVKDEGLTFKLNADGKTYSVTGMSSTSDVTDILIPASYNGKRVTAVAPMAFSGNTSIKTVRFEGTAEDVVLSGNERLVSKSEGVITIGDGAFAGCTMLRRVYLAATTESIGKNAFLGDGRLEYCDLPTSLKTIGDSAFKDTGIEYVSTYGTKLESIGAEAFSGCKSLRALYLNDGLRSIGSSAFENCAGIIQLFLPASVGTVGDRAFAGTGLKGGPTTVYSTSVVFGTDAFPPSNQNERQTDPVTGLEYYPYAGLTGNEAKITGRGSNTSADLVIPAVIAGRNVTGVSGFARDMTVKSVVIEEGITDITRGAFDACPALERVVLPSTLREIGEGAFAACPKLTEIITGRLIDENGNVLTKLEKNVFLGSPGISLEPDENGLCYKLAADGKSYEVISFTACGKRVITLPSTHKGLPVTAISAPLHTTYTLWNEYNSMEEYTVTEFVIPDSVSYLFTGALSNFAYLEKVRLPAGLAEIPDGCFSNDKSLKTVVIPSSAEKIGAYAFFGCYSLESAVIPDGVTDIGAGAFSHCVKLTDIALPASLRAIPEECFYSCYNLRELTVPASVATVGDHAFTYDTLLEKIDYKNPATKLEGDPYYLAGSCWIPGAAYVYDEASGLRFTENPDGSYTVAGIIPGATSVKLIPDRLGGKPVTAIGDYAFVSSKFLSGALVIPDTVLSVGRGAFCNCGALQSVVLPDSCRTVAKYAFNLTGNLRIEAGKDTVFEEGALDDSATLIKK